MCGDLKGQTSKPHVVAGRVGLWGVGGVLFLSYVPEGFQAEQ